MERIEINTLASIAITLPDGSKVELIPCDRTVLPQLRQRLLELQSYWLENRFGTGETVADNRAWSLMQEILTLIPRKDNPATRWTDLGVLSNDYRQLEHLFFADTSVISPGELHSWRVVDFDMTKFVGARLVQLHSLNPKLLLEEADDIRNKRIIASLEAAQAALEAVAVSPVEVEEVDPAIAGFKGG